MPCAPRMRGCRASCLHRTLVHDYRAARANAEAERERVTAMYAAELAEFGPVLTFRDWLLQTAGSARELQDVA